MDLAAAATPLYLASMWWERRALQRRTAEAGATAADYTALDTRTSLAMGIGSLVVPVTQAIGRHVVLGRRGVAKRALVAVGGAVAVTTIADRVARRAERRQQVELATQARRVAGVTGVAAIATGGFLLTALTGALSAPDRQWTRKGHTRDLGRGALPWAIAMVGWDFAYYWNHRLQHEIRAMWAIHVVHHSSERFNLSTALRQPVASAFGVWVPYGAMARLGVRPALIEYSRGLNLIYQYWIHTDLVRSIGPAEEVLNTPSHHRVHHGSNHRYLDRNHGGILIIWDRLFGTFQRELDEDPVVYGLTRNIADFADSPRGLWRAMTHEYRSMFADVSASTNWRDRLSFTLRGPGWAYRRQAELAAAA